MTLQSNSRDPVGQSLKEAAILPAFDEELHARLMAALVRLPAPARRDRNEWRVLWFAGAGLAACVAMALYAVRAPAAPPDDVSSSVAAVASAAAPARQLALLPLARVHRDLSAFHDDGTTLARFVTDQLDVLPGAG